jgi:hypothetical protein
MPEGVPRLRDQVTDELATGGFELAGGGLINDADVVLVVTVHNRPDLQSNLVRGRCAYRIEGSEDVHDLGTWLNCCLELGSEMYGGQDSDGPAAVLGALSALFGVAGGVIFDITPEPPAGPDATPPNPN